MYMQPSNENWRKRRKLEKRGVDAVRDERKDVRRNREKRDVRRNRKK